MNDIATQYRIIAAGAGWIEKSVRGRLQFDGRDRISFLQALLTNDIAALTPGAGAYAVYLTPQGRMITDLHVFVREQSVIADVPVALAPTLTETFDRLLFSEDVTVSNQSAAMIQLSVFGGRAADMLGRALGLAPEALSSLPAWSQLDAGAGFVVRTDDIDDGSWDLVVQADAAATVITALESTGIVPASRELVEALRIDAGHPVFGVDMTSDSIPLEAGLLDRAISQSKGCYVGQEVIIRILHRGAGRVAIRLAQMTCDAMDAPVPTPGAKISVDGNEVGLVTSAAWSPRSRGVIALGYLARAHAEPGRAVSMEGSGAATIRKLAS